MWSPFVIAVGSILAAVIGVLVVPDLPSRRRAKVLDLIKIRDGAPEVLRPEMERLVRDATLREILHPATGQRVTRVVNAVLIASTACFAAALVLGIYINDSLDRQEQTTEQALPIAQDMHDLAVDQYNDAQQGRTSDVSRLGKAIDKDAKALDRELARADDYESRIHTLANAAYILGGLGALLVLSAGTYRFWSRHDVTAERERITAAANRLTRVPASAGHDIESLVSPERGSAVRR